MANVTTQVPIILDSTGTKVTTANLHVRVLYWSGATVNASLQLKDGSTGKQVFAIDALYGNNDTIFNWPVETPLLFPGGITVATISSGRVFLWPM